jgi:hypothetical protein
MRLRSSQFVFLLLLVCSLQIREDYASQLLAQAVAGESSVSPAMQASAPGERSTLPSADRIRPATTIHLTASSLAAHRTVWTVRRPASHAAAVVSFTGFLRA